MNTKGRTPPLGMPWGSVRALAMLIPLVTACAMWYQQIPVPVELVALVGAATGGYYITRYSEGRTDETKTTMQRIEAKVDRSIETSDLLPKAREQLQAEQETVAI